jgi:hypothetical protein
MGEKTEHLELKLSKIDLKQWIPVLGIHYANRDLRQNKPSFMNYDKNQLTFLCSAVYQLGSMYATVYGISEVVNNFF